MPEKLDPEELVSFKELLMADMIEIQTIAKLLVEKGIFSWEEYSTKLKQVQAEFNSKAANHNVLII